MSSSLISYVAWTFLPNMVTGWVQSIWYGISIRAGDPRPQPGSPRYMKHRRRIHIGVIVIYLMYMIFEADWEIRKAGDFYQDLGVSQYADEKAIRSRFRRLAVIYHPDKLSSDSPDGSDWFMHLKLAQDTLLNGPKRFAYDRFGPDMVGVEWKHCHSTRDYMLKGALNMIPYYVASAFVMVLLSVLGYFNWGRYWRYLAAVSLVVLEAHTITHQTSSIYLLRIFNSIFKFIPAHPPLLPFQLLKLARKATLATFIFISQLSGHFETPSSSSSPSASSSSQHHTLQLNRLDALSKAVQIEADRLLKLNLASFQGDEAGVGEVRGKVREWLVQNTIRADPEVRNAVGRVLERRKNTGPGSVQR
ncbi:MAG: hypothetical protein M1834_007183 [Cirrosporium novae-zelandiae]|nr:MAG: hypothetical protein M1834_007183 [Cirrosporium novae-zelandiae]